MIEWREWTEVEGGSMLIDQVGNVAQAAKSLCHQMKVQFKFHHYVKRTQEKAFEELKSSSNTGKVVLQVDFAESYGVTCQNDNLLTRETRQVR